jgi:predicted dehydrogenase
MYYDTIKRLGIYELDSIVSVRNSSTIEAELGLPVFRDVFEVDGHREVDGFIIATPPGAHFEIASACLKMRYPVLIEKPFGDNLAQSRSLYRCAQEHNTFCMVGFQLLFAPNYQVFKNKVNTSDIVSVYSDAIGYGPFRDSVSVIRDWGSHEIALAVDFFNEDPCGFSIKRLAGEAGNQTAATYYMRMEFSSGRSFCSIFGNLAKIKRRSLIAIGNGEAAYINFLDQGGCVVVRNGEVCGPGAISVAGELPVDAMLSYFVDHAKRDAFVPGALDRAIQVADIMERIVAEAAGE